MKKSLIVLYWFIFKPRSYVQFNYLIDTGYNVIDAFNMVYYFYF